MSQYTHFTFAEFDDPTQPGSGEKYMDRTFIRRLDKARAKAGIAFIVEPGGGYRSTKYNEDAGGVPNSAHTKGLAVDFDYKSEEDKITMLKALEEVGFTRFGIRTGKSGTSIHVDSDENKPQYAVWGYENVSPGYKFDSSNNLVSLA